jgi:hypothetical protein
MKELSDWLRREGANCQKHIDCADALERLTAERDAARLSDIQQTDYAIGLQRAIEAHCRDEDATEDVCPHHAEKLNLHISRTQVLEKEHKEFYGEVVQLRSMVEHLRLREERLTAERDAWRIKANEHRDGRLANAELVAKLTAERDEYQVAADSQAMTHKIERDGLGMQIDALKAEQLARFEAIAAYTVDLESQRDALAKYQLPDPLYPDSKDWLAGDYAARVEWLHTGYEAKKAEIESLLQQVEFAHQAGNAKVTGSPALSASPRGLPGYAGEDK